jgi:hypothetical protein
VTTGKIERSHIHHGVCLAVNEFVKTSDFELIMAGNRGQWALRHALDDAAAERAAMLQKFETVDYGWQPSTCEAGSQKCSPERKKQD